MTVGTGGYTTPTACFDQLLHLFLNGAVGFSYFAEFDFGDMQYWVEIAELLAILTKYIDGTSNEDIIADGQVVFDNLTASNAVASAMQYGQRTLIGITPVDPEVALSVTLDVATTQHVLHNLRTNETLAGSGRSVTVDGMFDRSQIFLVVSRD